MALPDFDATTKSSLPPIMKHKRSNWKALPTEGDSVGIGDKTLSQGYLGDLMKKTKTELEELITRQDKLLNNSAFISKLKDGGAKIRERREQIQLALDEVSKEVIIPLPDMTSVEWQWRDPSETKSNGVRGPAKDHLDALDSDDDDVDPLKLLANHSSVVPDKIVSERNVINEESDPSEAIRLELRNLELRDEVNGSEEKERENFEIEHKKVANADVFSDFGSKLLSSLEEKTSRKPMKEVFKPFRPKSQQKLVQSSEKTIIFNSEESSIEEISTKSPHPTFGIDSKPNFPAVKKINLHKSSLWACESSATGLLNFNNCRQVKPLSLRESIDLGTKTQLRLKQIELDAAKASLMRYKKPQNATVSIKPSMDYRNNSMEEECGSSDESSDEQ